MNRHIDNIIKSSNKIITLAHAFRQTGNYIVGDNLYAIASTIAREAKLAGTEIANEGQEKEDQDQNGSPVSHLQG